MELGIAGRLALVTGATGGIGRAIALRLAEEGVNLVLTSRTEKKLDILASEIRQFGTNAVSVPADLTQLADVEMVVNVADGLGGVDILVNNAGGTPWGPLESFDDQSWLEGLKLKPLSYVRAARLVLPKMKEKTWGRIVNVGGLESKTVWPNYNLGMISATAIQALTKSLAEEVASSGILVTAVHPGGVDTPRIQKYVESTNETHGTKLTLERRLEQLAAHSPMGRVADAKEVADAVLFLASERASFITGTSLFVDGGASRAVH